MPHNGHGDICLNSHRYLPSLVFAAPRAALFLFTNLFFSGTSGPSSRVDFLSMRITVRLLFCPTFFQMGRSINALFFTDFLWMRMVTGALLFKKFLPVCFPICSIACLDLFLIPRPLKASYDLSIIPNSFGFYSEIVKDSTSGIAGNPKNFSNLMGFVSQTRQVNCFSFPWGRNSQNTLCQVLGFHLDHCILPSIRNDIVKRKLAVIRVSWYAV